MNAGVIRIIEENEDFSKVEKEIEISGYYITDKIQLDGNIYLIMEHKREVN